MQQEQNQPEVGVMIDLAKPDDFLVIAETLTRIGVPSKKAKTLFQSCHLLHKRGTYRIVHFLELFILDGKQSTITEDDYRRRNTVAKLLEQWKLCKVLDRVPLEFVAPVSELKIVPFREKKDWALIAKYTIGNRKPE